MFTLPRLISCNLARNPLHIYHPVKVRPTISPLLPFSMVTRAKKLQMKTAPLTPAQASKVSDDTSIFLEKANIIPGYAMLGSERVINVAYTRRDVFLSTFHTDSTRSNKRGKPSSLITKKVQSIRAGRVRCERYHMAKKMTTCVTT